MLSKLISNRLNLLHGMICIEDGPIKILICLELRINILYSHVYGHTRVMQKLLIKQQILPKPTAILRTSTKFGLHQVTKDASMKAITISIMKTGWWISIIGNSSRRMFRRWEELYWLDGLDLGMECHFVNCCQWACHLY